MATKHGHTSAKNGPGCRRASRTYRSWHTMKQRCLNPNHAHFDNYGGRGIKVCDRWLSFENFLADMGERPDGKMLDRIETDGHYEPTNCRWATNSLSAHNRRKKPGTSSRFPGVSKHRNRWRATYRRDGKSVQVGAFATEEEAFAARQAAVAAIFTP